MRIVVKIGSSVLTQPDGLLYEAKVADLVAQISTLKHSHDVVLVSSGAVAAGKAELACRQIVVKDEIAEKQIAASIGQVKLMALYDQLFSKYNISCGQVLTIGETIKSRAYYLTHKKLIESMCRRQLIPIINENDALSLVDLMFTDNDALAALIATMVGADILILLTTVDGIYTGSLSDPSSRLIRTVKPGEDLSSYITGEISALGRGGMATKFKSARQANLDGIPVIIANGHRRGILAKLLSGASDTPHTLLEAYATTHTTGPRKWLAQAGSFATGKIYVDLGAKTAIQRGQSSVLMVGIQQVSGTFEKHDVIAIYHRDPTTLAETKLAYGMANYDSNFVAHHIGQRVEKPVIHANYLRPT